MKLKNYFISTLVALFIITTVNSQEQLINWDFPEFEANDFSGWWPLGWEFGGEWSFNCITAGSTKRIQFEHIDGTDFRQVYQNVKLGIGTFEITTNAKIEEWDVTSPYNIVVTDVSGAEIARMNLELTDGYEDFGPIEFSTTEHSTYKFSIECSKKEDSGWSQAWYMWVSLKQIDGDEYDPDSDTTAGLDDLASNSCYALVNGDQLRIKSEEAILGVTLFSAYGSLIYQTEANSNELIIRKPQQNGVYLIAVQTATHKKVIKIKL